MMVTGNKYLNDNEGTAKDLLNGIDEIMMLLDTQGMILSANDACAKTFNTPLQELAGSSIFKYMSSELASSRKAKMEQLVKTGEPVRFHDEDNGIYYNHQMFPIFDSKGQVTKIAALSQDVTAQIRIEEAFRDSEERFRSVFENSATGIALLTLDGHYFMVNKSLCNLVGYSEEELSNMTFHDITYPEDLCENLLGLEKLFKGEIKSFQMEKRYVHKSGNIIWVLISLALVRDSAGEPFYMVGQIQNITKRKRAEEDLRAAKLEAEKAREEAEKARLKAESLARTDYLTGLLNRRAFMDRLTEEANRMLREHAPLSIILTDIDFFKRINDTYGHKTGDLVLQKFSSCLADVCREYDFIGRYGGEEFIICLPNTMIEQANSVAERMRTSVEELEIPALDGLSYIHITSSFGVASSILTGAEYANLLINYADDALYKAKIYGRNQVCLAGNKCCP